MLEKTTNNTTTSRNETFSNNNTTTHIKHATRSVEKTNISNIIPYTRNNQNNPLYNKFTNNSLIKTKEFDDLITENIPNFSNYQVVNNEMSWDIHKFTIQNLKNNQLIDYSPKKTKETNELIENNFNFFHTKKNHNLSRSLIHNTHYFNNSINEDTVDYMSKKKEVEGQPNIMSPSKIRENITKALVSKVNKNLSIDSNNIKDSSKTRNKIQSSIYGSQPNKTKYITNQSSNAVKSTKTIKDTNTKTTLNKLTKPTQNEDNIVINSFYKENFTTNKIENRNETLYLFSKIKAENKKNDEIIMKEKKMKEEMKKCTFKPKITPINKINDLFRAPSSNLVKYLKITNPKNTKLSYIDRLQAWEKNKKEKKEKKAKEGQEEARIVCTHKPSITRSVPKFNNKNELDIAHKLYINRVSSARKQKEEVYNKLNPNYSLLYDKNERRHKNKSCDLLNKTYTTNKQSELFYKASQKILHNNLQSLVAAFDNENDY